jgi:hypothetical protein
MTYRTSISLLIIASFSIAALPAFAASAEVTGEVDCGVTCQLNGKIRGEIDASAPIRLNQLIDDARQKAHLEKRSMGLGSLDFEIDSAGGSVNAAMAIGRLFRKERATIMVPHWGSCHSACVLVLAGAVGRLVGGKVGIHRPYLEVPQQQVAPEKVRELYQKMLLDMRAYLREMNVSEQLADAMLRIEPGQLRILSDTALSAYGLVTVDPIEQETVDLQDAQYWGISRAEYMRRRALVRLRCGITRQWTCEEPIMRTGRAP